MAVFTRHRHSEEEEESVFISMTDLMISILFIVMILMAFFARATVEDSVPKETYKREISLRDETIDSLAAEIAERDARMKSLMAKVTDEEQEIGKLNLQILELEKINSAQLRRIQTLEEEIKQLKRSDVLARISETRAQLLSAIENRLLERGITVKVDLVNGVLRFDEDVIRFASASFEPTAIVLTNMQQVAEILADELKCYTLGSHSTVQESCNKNLSIVEAVQIEGHTDNNPIKPSDSIRDNLDLSAKRAAATYRAFVEHRPLLKDYLNANYILDPANPQEITGQPVLSVSGYADTRPIKFENDASAHAVNRRIDLRFIMTTPKDLVEAQKLVSAVRSSSKRSADNQ